MPGELSNPPVRQLNHVSVTTGDIDRSVRFYRDVVGLTVLGSGTKRSPELAAITGFPDLELRWAELGIEGFRFLELFEYVSPHGRRLEQRTSDPGCMHFALSVRDIDAIHDAVTKSDGTVVAPPVTLRGGDWDGARAMYVRDPDGATVEFIEFPVGNELFLGSEHV
ncbi:VOC family protein [Mycobacterium sp. ACS4331]|uniref:VOC family protein n=1 Tax=Mycobacterium sp. ACS4331 TaxID=1834121 RepID=UPI0007FFC299|nr:VOC family protein [Mycobacterium sp. ACS4331]OBF13731.1 hypothetical protein A5727_16895 [Mycobacterium sp. ACS4331]